MLKFDSNLTTIVTKILKSNHVPMLLGEPGIGKSSWVEDLGRSMHTKVFVLACNQLADKADMTGSRLMPIGERVITNPDGSTSKEIDYAQKFFPHVVIKKAIDYANSHPTETPILFMDELNRTTADVTSEALSIPTLRSIGDVDLPKNLRIVTAGNDKGNITSLDTASRSRFVLLHVQPDAETFIQVNPKLNIFVKNVISKHPESLFGTELPASLTGAKAKKDDDDDDDVTYNIDDIYDDSEEMKQITTPRTITSVSEWLNCCTTAELNQFIAQSTLDADGNPITILQEVLEAHTGQTMFTTLLLQEIITNLNTVSQPSTMTVPKPNCYDTLVNMPSRQELLDYISKLSDSDKGGCLVYALSVPDDNSEIINALAKEVTKLEKEDTRNLGTLFGTNAISDINQTAFFEADTPVSEMWKNMFGN